MTPKSANDLLELLSGLEEGGPSTADELVVTHLAEQTADSPLVPTDSAGRLRDADADSPASRDPS
jgi:hypothetical protein